MDAQTSVIDRGIEALDKYIDATRQSARMLFRYLAFATAGMLVGIFAVSLIPLSSFDGLGSERVSLFLVGFTALIFFIFAGTYRFHLNEISKAEHYKIGFLRIKASLEESSKGAVPPEVLLALTQDTFKFNSSTPTFLQGKRVESPVPGHPGSDMTALIINRLFDQLEASRDKDKV